VKTDAEFLRESSSQRDEVVLESNVLASRANAMFVAGVQLKFPHAQPQRPYLDVFPGNEPKTRFLLAGCIAAVSFLITCAVTFAEVARQKPTKVSFWTNYLLGYGKCIRH
jgi:hypothetical protein